MTDAAVRGTTTVSEKAVRKIAERAAAEALPGFARPSARGSASVRGRRAVVSLGVTLPYPAPLASTAERVERHVTDRTGRLTGLRLRARAGHRDRTHRSGPTVRAPAREAPRLRPRTAAPLVGAARPGRGTRSRGGPRLRRRRGRRAAGPCRRAPGRRLADRPAGHAGTARSRGPAGRLRHRPRGRRPLAVRARSDTGPTRSAGRRLARPARRGGPHGGGLGDP